MSKSLVQIEHYYNCENQTYTITVRRYGKVLSKTNPPYPYPYAALTYPIPPNCSKETRDMLVETNERNKNVTWAKVVNQVSYEDFLKLYPDCKPA